MYSLFSFLHVPVHKCEPPLQSVIGVLRHLLVFQVSPHRPPVDHVGVLHDLQLVAQDLNSVVF